MRTISIILSLLLIDICVAQNKSDTLCDLQAKNNEWKLNFEKVKDKSEKVSLIKQKVFSDSVYTDYNADFKTHGVEYRAVDKSGNDCGCRIFFHLGYGKSRSVVLNVSENPNLKRVVENLDVSNIEQIMPFFDGKAEKMYGPFGKCGAVMLRTNDKKLIELIKKAR